MRQSLIKNIITSGFIFFILSGNVSAEWAWLKQSAASYFNKDDWALLKKTTITLLDSGKKGESNSWSNESSQNQGKVTILGSYEENSQSCRKVKFHNEAGAHGTTGTMSYRFCQQSDKSWKVSP